MPTPEEALRVLRQIRAVAEQEGDALIQAFRLLADGALIGPAGTALYGRMAERHRATKAAFTEAFARADELARQAVPPPREAYPYIPYPPRLPHRRPHERSGSPATLQNLITELIRAGTTWQDAGRRITSLLTSLNLAGTPGTRISNAGSDLLTEPPDLRRRLELLMRSEANPAALLIWQAIALAQMNALKATDPALYQRLLAAGADLADVPVTNPSDAAAWWSLLTREQRTLYTRAFPNVIGWTNGLPVTARDKANRLTLTTRLTDLQAIPTANLTDFQTRDLTRLLALSDKMAAVEARTGEKLFLLGFDSTTAGPWDGYDKNVPLSRILPGYVADGTKGPDGRVILSIGNPDKLKHTGVYVPGTTTQLDSIGGDMERAMALWTRSQRYAPGQVSTIVWLGYDAPDAIVADAPRNLYLTAGAPELQRFVNGLRTSHTGNAHLTAVGHSYGSTLIGEAAIGGKLDVDDIVVAGSPGMHVENAKDLGIGDDHVWAMAAEADPVPALGSEGHGRAPATLWWAPGAKVVPSDPSFGSQILRTDTRGHSDYWNNDTISLDNQARVLAETHANANLKDDPVLKPEQPWMTN